jgi:hypothetical protein
MYTYSIYFGIGVYNQLIVCISCISAPIMTKKNRALNDIISSLNRIMRKSSEDNLSNKGGHNDREVRFLLALHVISRRQ